MLGLFWGAWFVCAIFTAVIASSRGRSGFGWFVLGALFGIFALIAAAAMPIVAKTEAASGPAASPGMSPMIVCPHCNRYIPRSFGTCPNCEKSLSTIRCPKCLSYIKRDENPCPWCGQGWPTSPPPSTRAGPQPPPQRPA